MLLSPSSPSISDSAFNNRSSFPLDFDLNVSLFPEDENASPTFSEEEEEEEPQEKHQVYMFVPKKNAIQESAVEIMRREREERRQEMKRKREQQPKPDEDLDHPPQKKPLSLDRNKLLPPGWINCPPTGQVIADFIVPSKVPLAESFDDVVPPGKRYSMKQVIHKQKVLGRQIDLVIDLTNTKRYYQPLDWKRQHIEHVKIKCQGKDSVPDNESVNSFVYEVSHFLARKQYWNTKKYVLVHCTHGHNRTGFMIVHYLMRSRNSMSVTQALQVFADARPPGIYKQDYIDALYTFYQEKKPEKVVLCPPTPDWKRSCDFDLNESILEDDDGSPSSPLPEECVLNEGMTNDDILGDAISNSQQEELRQFCYQSLNLGRAAKGTAAQFPGSHPVSLNSENLELLRSQYYYATWKADGTRYMMLITRDGCYLIDRNFNFRRVQMRFPSRRLGTTHHFTLLDGEMVIDTDPGTQNQERRYLIYDLIALNKLSVKDKPFCERWKMIEEEVIQPRNLERQKSTKDSSYRYEMEPFRVRRKHFWLISTVNRLLKEFIPGLSHQADGLIFQGWYDPYVPRTHEGLLKWKYAEMNLVDFLYESEENRGAQIYLFERGQKKLLLENIVVFRDGSDPSKYYGKIIECSWDSEKGVWVCMRIRTDKSTPNEFNTYRKVMRSIKDNITEEVLFNEISEIVKLPVYADRARKDQLKHSGRPR